MLYSIRAQNKEHLKKLIEDQMATHGHRCDLNHIDVSLITDMSELFHNSRFNGDISQWDTREVVNINVINAELKTTVAKIDQLRTDIDAIVAEIEGEELEA